MKWHILDARKIDGVHSYNHTVLVSGLPPSYTLKHLTTLSDIVLCEHRVYFGYTQLSICSHKRENLIYERTFSRINRPTIPQVIKEVTAIILLNEL